ncbi:DUF6151 family protein [Piscinibacter sp.]|jgi:hypothetical protein|uniref:DUF6151 family protein n=1 Tax=Piscinibacter sp. TaxID=1903157 RepID=UPI00355A1E9E
MDHSLRCRCGTLQGTVTHTEGVNRGVCYCRDCQAYAHALGNAETILDNLGGSDVVATLQQYVTFTKGTEALACMSLTERGLLRWYAGCCNTPIGNTQRDPKVSFVGLLHNCLEHSTRSIDEAFGPVRMRVNTKYAKGKVVPMPLSTFTSVARFLGSVVRARLDGSYKRTPFFSAPSFKPVVATRVLSPSERERAMNAV